MPSNRKSVEDALVSALQGITGVGKVTRRSREFATPDPQDMPMLYVHTQKTEVERIAFPHSTSSDMEATLQITVEGRTYSPNDSDKDTDLDAFLQDVEQAIVGNSALTALVLDITVGSDTVDRGFTEEYGYFTAEYIAVYDYNHNTP